MDEPLRRFLTRPRMTRLKYIPPTERQIALIRLGLIFRYLDRAEFSTLRESIDRDFGRFFILFLRCDLAYRENENHDSLWECRFANDNPMFLRHLPPSAYQHFGHPPTGKECVAGRRSFNALVEHAETVIPLENNPEIANAFIFVLDTFHQVQDAVAYKRSIGFNQSDTIIERPLATQS